LSAAVDISQTEIHADWIEEISRSLQANGVETRLAQRPAYEKQLDNGTIRRRNPTVALSSLYYRDFLGEAKRWYPASGGRSIPLDFDISNSTTLAYWLMGDGNVTTPHDRLEVRLHTNRFKEADVRQLVFRFESERGIHGNVSHWRGQPIIVFQHQNAELFLAPIRELVSPSFAYKTPENPWRMRNCSECGLLVDGETRNKQLHTACSKLRKARRHSNWVNANRERVREYDRQRNRKD
jgi:hypothetical protein